MDKVKLGDCCVKIGSGATPKGGAAVYIDSGTSFIRSQNVYNMHFDFEGLCHINEDAAIKLNGVAVFPEDILLNITGDSVARCCIVPDVVLPARVSQHVSIVRPDKTKILPKYLLYYLCSPFMQATMLGVAVGKGASRNAMTKGMIEGFEVPCPSLSEQQRIISQLEPFDAIIENSQKQIALLEEAAQRVYKEWFVDLRFPGYESSILEDGIPRGWRKEQADSFFDITIGKTPPRAESKWFVTEGGIPWVSISDMGKSGTYVFDTNEQLTADAITKHNVKVVQPGTVFVSFKLTVGKVSIATVPMCTNEAIAHFRIPEIALRDYSYWYLHEFKYDTLGNTSSISQAVNSKIIKAMPFIMPDTKTIEAFSSIVSPMMSQIKTCQEKCIMAEEARDILLQKLLTEVPIQ
ncbi:MAG: restriction endonuclease subunit S [Bacteroidales bacterium]|nr:restriction endonuclease subunit S [Bacteroidales bacterium]